MQYILTQEEYDKLRRGHELKLQLANNKLQALCTKICNEMPVMVDGNGLPTTWGCILDKMRGMEYCDGCPVREICPHPYKEYSR